MTVVTAIIVLVTAATTLVREYVAFKRDRLKARKHETKRAAGVDEE